MVDTAYEPRLKTIYRDEIRAKMKEQFGYTNEMQVPKLDKVVLNMGVGEATSDSKKVNAAMKDLAAIAPMAAIQTIAVVNPALPLHNIGELVAYAKANPGKLAFGSSGIGTSNHLSVELFKVVAGVDMLHVPYKSAGQALPDVISGQVNLMFDLMPSAINHVRQGRLRALAVTGPKRSPAAPELPTVAEAGVAGYEFTAWFGLFAPAATPKEVVARLNAAVVKAIESPDLKARMEQLGAEPFAATPEQFAVFFKGEVDKWARVVREGRLPVQE